MDSELRLGILILLFGTLLLFEARRPLRRATQPKGKRILVNFGVATIAALLLRFSLYPLVAALAAQVEARQYGLLQWLKLSQVVTMALAIVLLDWTFYYWHWMLHRISFLWRFHNAHHVDLDMDASTALRFHFGELAISTVYRSAQVVVLGISPLHLILFELLITAFALFHHANIRLPEKLERVLSRVIVTPRLHGIHHSTVRNQTDSNYSTILSVWDVLHRTLKKTVPQPAIIIGVPAYRNPHELGLIGTLTLPFRRRRPWSDQEM